MPQRSPVITSKPTLCLDSWLIWGEGYVLSTSLPLMTQPCLFSLCPSNRCVRPHILYTAGFITYTKTLCFCHFSCNIFSLAPTGGSHSSQLSSESCSGNCLQLKKAPWAGVLSPPQGSTHPKAANAGGELE